MLHDWYGEEMDRDEIAELEAWARESAHCPACPVRERCDRTTCLIATDQQLQRTVAKPEGW